MNDRHRKHLVFPPILPQQHPLYQFSHPKNDAQCENRGNKKERRRRRSIKRNDDE